MNNEINFLHIRLCFINVYTYPNPKPISYKNEKTVIIVVQLPCIDVRMPSSVIRIPSSLNPSLTSLFWKKKVLYT